MMNKSASHQPMFQAHYLKKTGFLLKKLLPLRFGLMNVVATGTLIYFFIAFSLVNGIKPFDFSVWSAIAILFSIVTVNLLVQMINLITAWNRFVRLLLHEMLILVLWLLNAYHLNTHVPPDFEMIADNLGLILSKNSINIVRSSFHLRYIIMAIAIMVAVAWAELGFRRLSILKQENPLPIKMFLSLALYTGAVIGPLPSYDPITALIQDPCGRDFPVTFTKVPVSGYPYLKTTLEISGRFPSQKNRKPDIFLVMIESFNANSVELKTPDGREITPVFNKLLKQGIYYDRFYGNSIQTCKGQATTLLSILPSVRGKIFTSYPNLKFKALPSYMAAAGYDTLFIQAGEDLSFENTLDFMKRAGFAEVHSVHEFIGKEDRDEIRGYGSEDRLLYQAFFTYLDRRKAATGGKPVFAMLATVANHTPFDKIPDDRDILFPRPLTFEQRYANSIHLSDHQLRDLLDMAAQRRLLADTVIIITGDHSFPINEHGYSHNENGFYDESFRTPFLILWKDRLSPQRISRRACSQVDIAPTILDLANIRTGANSFLGRSLFLKNTTAEIVYLVQPYHGVYLQVIRYPYKYIFHKKTGAEYMFHLANDPSEKNNIVHQVPLKLLNDMRNDIKTIAFNQRIIETNSLYP